MAKKKVTLATNIGEQDRRRFGLLDYNLPELVEGKDISIEEKHLAHFVSHGWVKTDEGTTIRTATAAQEPEEESPVADTPVPKAVEMIGNMRSREKLQHIIDTDQRASVKDAARKRLASLQ